MLPQVFAIVACTQSLFLRAASSPLLTSHGDKRCRCWAMTVWRLPKWCPTSPFHLHVFNICFVFCFVLIGFTTEASWPCLRDKQNQCLSVTHNIRRANVRRATPPPHETPAAQQGTFSAQSRQALLATSPSGGSWPPPPRSWSPRSGATLCDLLHSHAQFQDDILHHQSQQHYTNTAIWQYCCVYLHCCCCCAASRKEPFLIDVRNIRTTFAATALRTWSTLTSSILPSIVLDENHL